MPRAPLLPPLTPPRLLPPRAWLLLFWLPAVFLFAVPQGELAAVFRDTGFPDFREHRDLADLDNPTTGTLRLSGSWRPVKGGFSPADTSETALEIDVPPGPWDAAWITVYGAPGSRWSARITRELTLGADTTIASRTLAAFDPEKPVALFAAEIPGAPRAWEPMTLRLRATEPGASRGDEYPLLRRVVVRFAVLEQNRLPCVPDWVAAGLAPLLAAAALRLLFGMSEKRAMIVGVGVGFLLTVATHLGKGEAGGAGAVATGLALVGGIAAALSKAGWNLRRAPSLDLPAEALGRIAASLLGAGLLLLALSPRWAAFAIARRSALDPDALGFLQIATSGAGLYETAQSFGPWVREPLIVWLIRLWLMVAPDSVSSVRLGALLLAMAVLAVVYLVGRRVVGLWPAVAACAALAIAPEWARMASRILRLDLMVLMAMGCVAARIMLAERTWWRAAAWGVLGAAFALTRISTISFVLPVLAWEMWRGKWKPAECTIAIALFALPLLPHLAFNYRFQDSRDPFFSSTVHTRFFLNAEHIGEPGFPTAAEYRENPYLGEPVSAIAYFTRHHTIAGTIAGHVRGYWNLFVWKGPRIHLFRGHEWLMLPGLLGAWALWKRGLLWLAVWFALLAFPVAFISSRGADWRLGAEAHVLVLWVWAIGVEEAVSRVRRWRKSPPAAAA